MGTKNIAGPAGKPNARLDIVDQPAELLLRLSGTWKLSSALPGTDELKEKITHNPGLRRIAFDVNALASWDSGLLLFLRNLSRICAPARVELAVQGLPLGVRRLMKMAPTSFGEEAFGKQAARPSLLERTGDRALDLWAALLDAVDFLGETTLAFFRLCAGSPGFRFADFSRVVQDCGVNALPIVSLISFLVGLILAFVGSVQLGMFGAHIYVANLVGISMARAMGAIMTGIIMAGRTGASFAAGIGTMQVNEEIDALKTAGISPIRFLVLPRVLATAIMMPLLTLYADVMGMFGGVVVAATGLDINPLEYFGQTKAAVNLANVGIGVFSGFVFGLLVGLTGCLKGMQCGRSASAVGSATTKAVVSGIVSIIVATAIITIICDVLRI